MNPCLLVQFDSYMDLEDTRDAVCFRLTGLPIGIKEVVFKGDEEGFGAGKEG